MTLLPQRCIMETYCASPRAKLCRKIILVIQGAIIQRDTIIVAPVLRLKPVLVKTAQKAKQLVS